jgi:hypothetical protein
VGRIATAALAWLVGVTTVMAQDLEPRAYSASPVGTTFLVGSYTRSAGAILLDPTLPIADVSATVEAAILGLGRSFGLFGDTASVAVAVPYAWASLTGRVGGDSAATSRAGLADMRVRLAVNLVGNPAMGAQEFARRRRRTIVGASLVVQAPSGQYDENRLINLGNHRWSFKPEAGISLPIRRLDADLYAAGWFFTANDRFFPGDVERTQDPMFAVQAHVSYTLRPRLWVAVDSTWYRGGAATVGGGAPSLALDNSRAGLTVSLPLGNRYSLKAAYASGVAVRTGTNFDTVSIAWQALWVSR